MANIQWIKIVTDVFDNRKIRQIELMPDADAILVIWFKILCLAGTINESGLLLITRDIPYNDEMLANQFNRPINTIRLALNTFQKFGMIEMVDDILCVSNWEKYQSVEALAKIREQTRLRVAKHREKQRVISNEVGNEASNVTVTQRNATEENKNKNKNKKREEIYKDLPVELHIPIEDFIENRRLLKKPMTDRAIELMLKKLNKLSDGDTRKSVAILEQSIENGWIGIFPLKEIESGNPFKERLRKELEDEQARSDSNNVDSTGIFSKLLQG